MQHEAADTDLELVYNSTHSAAVKERLGLPAQEERVQLLFEVGRELYLLAAEFSDDDVVMQPMLQISLPQNSAATHHYCKYVCNIFPILVCRL